MDSDHKWYDVEFTIRGKLRVENYNKDGVALQVSDILSSIDYNPARYDSQELVGTPEVEIVGVQFFPQGYKQVDA